MTISAQNKLHYAFKTTFQVKNWH